MKSVKTYNGLDLSKINKTSTNNASKSIEQEVNPEHSEQELKAKLENLEPEQRQQIIADVFKNDIDVIIKTESKKGFEAGLKDGLAKANEQIQESVTAQKKIINKQISDFHNLLVKIDKHIDTPLICEDEINNAIASTIFVLLGERLNDGEYLMQHVNRAIEASAISRKVNLYLSSQDFNLVMTNFKSLYPETEFSKVNILEDKLMTVGDIKLEYSNGSIESSFFNSLEDWVSNLKNIKRATDLG